MTVLGSIATAILAITAVKIAISFDLNRWLEQRREWQTQRLKALCPHVTLELADDGKGFWIRPLMLSPPGTMMWVCERCGLKAHSEDLIEALMRQYNKEGMEALIKRERKFQKYAKKHLGI